MHVLRHPQELFRRFTKEKEGGWCMPLRKGSTRETLDAVKHLEGDVNEVMKVNPNPDMAVCASESIKVGQNIVVCEQVSQDVHKHLQTILSLIKFLTGDTEGANLRAMSQNDAADLLEQLIAADLPVQLLAQLPLMQFETRKDIMNVCCALLWSGMPQHVNSHVMEYFRDHPRVFKLLVDGYANEEVALHFGVVLRSCVRHKELARAFVASGQVLELLKYASHPSIDISSDAFYSLRETLMEHKEVSSAWLSCKENFDEFFKSYNTLLKSEEYLGARQAQKLLGEILLDRHFRSVMLAYVNNERNLQIHMNLLKDKSKVIQADAFHVFKVFAANPQKTPRVQKILYQNREKLLHLLDSLVASRPDDKKFADELRSVSEKLRNLDAPLSPSMSKAPSDPTLAGVSTQHQPGRDSNGSGEYARSETAKSEVSTTCSTSL